MSFCICFSVSLDNTLISLKLLFSSEQSLIFCSDISILLNGMFDIKKYYDHINQSSYIFIMHGNVGINTIKLKNIATVTINNPTITFLALNILHLPSPPYLAFHCLNHIHYVTPSPP